MHQNGRNLFIEDLEDGTALAAVAVTANKVPAHPPLTWDWAIEHEDRKRERKADAASHEPTPFEVDRKILKDVVREKMGVEVGRIRFLNSGEPEFQPLPLGHPFTENNTHRNVS